jgi:PBP1b-binding outer membrane lipoprotein LpoB
LADKLYSAASPNRGIDVLADWPILTLSAELFRDHVESSDDWLVEFSEKQMKWSINLKQPALCFAMLALVAGCASPSSGVINAAGTPTQTLDLTRPGPVDGVGLANQDIGAITEKMIRSMLANPQITNRTNPAQILIDANDFENASAQRMDKSMIVDDIFTNLVKAANGRIVFVDRANLNAVMKERKLKRSGVTDVGTIGLTRGTAGVDYKLVGSFRMKEERSRTKGMIQRRNQIFFKMIDMERGVTVWADDYVVARAGQDDVIYR